MSTADDEANAPRSQSPGPAGPAQVRLGVVLCGGRSRRMGRDKARLDVNGRSLLVHSIEVLEELAPDVVLSCGTEDRYAELGRERVLDALEDAGPLAGLAAGLRRLASEPRGSTDGVLFALACDMPRARAGVFELLLERLQSERADLCLLSSPQGVEPLYGVYHGRCLPAIERALARGDRKLTSFHEEVRVALLADRDLPAALLGTAPATNVNTPEEYHQEFQRERRA